MISPVEIKNEQYNIGHICTKQQCDEGRGAKIAFRWIDASGKREEITFGHLDKESNRVANMLTALGYKKGDVVFTFLPNISQMVKFT